MSGTIVPNTDPAAIESGNSWNGLDTAGAPVIVTFSFPTSLPAYDASIGGFTDATDASFTAFTAQEQTQALAALNQWAAASGIVFVEVAPGDSDITFGNLDFSTTTTTSENGNFQNAGGIGFYPFGNWSYSTGNYTTGFGFTSDQSPAGAVFMNSNYITNGSVDLGTLLHEIGHAIGMKHPDQVVYTADGTEHGQVLDPVENSATLTIMSETGDSANADNPTLFPLDQAAAANLYGPAGTGTVVTTSAAGANSVSNWIWDAGTETLVQTAESANETIHGTSVDDIIYGYDYGGVVPTTGTIAMYGLDGANTLYAGSGNTSLYGGPDGNTLYGGAGNDSFYVYSDETSVIDDYTTGDNTLFATGVNATLPENVDTLYLYGQGLVGTGNDQTDSIFGDGVYTNTLIAGTGNDYIVGGSGGNTLVAGTGIDTMYGGTGANRFVFGPNSAPIGNPDGTDYIGDFKRGTDNLDFSNYAVAGEPLIFIGTAPLTAPGQVDYFTSDGFTFVRGDVTSDGQADFEIQLNGTQALQASDLNLTPMCFLAGTGIATPGGEVPVERLAAGDAVTTASGAVRRVVWVGEGRVLVTQGRRSAATPVVVRKGALADNVPDRDLRITRAHSLYIDDVLIPVEFLVNHCSILWDDRVREASLFHIELETHDVLLANGAPAESFRNDGNRWLFRNAETGAGLPAQEACAPVLTGGPIVDAAWRRLLDRAGPRAGVTLTEDPDLHLLVDGVRVDSVRRSGAVHVFTLPAIPADARIVSRAAAPQELGLARDPRRLGVALRRIALWQASRLRIVDAADPSLSEGFHAFEADNGFRWTDGDAVVPPALFDGLAGPVELELTVPDTARYADEAVRRHAA
jgi:Ca2+-binding RTX toxin-like protein